MSSYSHQELGGDREHHENFNDVGSVHSEECTRNSMDKTNANRRNLLLREGSFKSVRNIAGGAFRDIRESVGPLRKSHFAVRFDGCDTIHL